MLGMTYLVTPLSVGGTKYNDAYVGLCVCLRVCLSVREHISRTTRTIFANFMPITYGYDSDLSGGVVLRSVYFRFYRRRHVCT